jgi:hypothetical protein
VPWTGKRGSSGIESAKMPSLFRFLLVVGVLGGLGYAGIFTLARMVDPQPREIVVTIPQDKLLKHR